MDSTWPFNGGAIMGDRIHMQRHATGPGVFIRSLATRERLVGCTPQPVLTLVSHISRRRL